MEGGDDDKRKWPGGDVIRTPLINGEVRNTTGWRRGPIRWQEEIQVPVRSMFPSKLQGRGLESPINYSWPPKTNPPSRLQSSRLPRFWGSRLGLQWSRLVKVPSKVPDLGLDWIQQGNDQRHAKQTQRKLGSIVKRQVHCFTRSKLHLFAQGFQVSRQAAKAPRLQGAKFRVSIYTTLKFHRSDAKFPGSKIHGPVRKVTTAHRKHRSWEPNDTIDL